MPPRFQTLLTTADFDVAYEWFRQMYTPLLAAHAQDRRPRHIEGGFDGIGVALIECNVDVSVDTEPFGRFFLANRLGRGRHTVAAGRAEQRLLSGSPWRPNHFQRIGRWPGTGLPAF